VHVVDRRGLDVREPRERRQAALGRPLLAREQHGRRAVGQRRRVAGRHGVAEHRLQLRQLLGRRVGAQVLVALQPEVRRDQVVEEAAVVRRRGLLVARGRELVLRLARDAVLLRRDRRVLAHREAGPRLGVARDVRDDVLRAHLRQPPHPAEHALLVARAHEHAPQVVVDAERRVARRVGPAGDAGLDLAERDLVRHEHRRLEARVAGLAHVVGRRLAVERRAEHDLAREVEVARVLEDGAGGDLVDALAGQPEARGEPVDHRRQHVLVGRLGVGSAGAGEGNSVAADDHCRPSRRHHFV
jgi:hypothetical protein